MLGGRVAAGGAAIERVQEELGLLRATGDILVDREETLAGVLMLARPLKDQASAAEAGLIVEGLEEGVEPLVDPLRIGELDLRDPVEGVDAALILACAHLREEPEEADLGLGIAAGRGDAGPRTPGVDLTDAGLLRLFVVGGGGLEVLAVDLHHHAQAQEHLKASVGLAGAAGRVEEAGQALAVALAQL